MLSWSGYKVDNDLSIAEFRVWRDSLSVLFASQLVRTIDFTLYTQNSTERGLSIGIGLEGVDSRE